MQSLRLKFGSRQKDWRCCFCCHVRTGTIFIGVLNLMSHLLALSMMSLTFSYPIQDPDPILPTPLSEVDKINFEVSGSNLEDTSSDGTPVKPQLLLYHSLGDFWAQNWQLGSYYELNVGIIITMCSFAMTLMLLYGAIKGKPVYMMPFLCVQVFDFFISCVTVFTYLCYPTVYGKMTIQSNHIPFKENFLNLHPQNIGLCLAVLFFVIMSGKAYIIGVVWSCYKYLTLRQIAAQRTVQFIDPDIQNLLPDLPDYETAMKKLSTPPPSYTSAIKDQYPITELSPGPQQLSAQNIVVPPSAPVTAPPCPFPQQMNSQL